MSHATLGRTDEEQHFPGGGAYIASKHRGVSTLRQCSPLEPRLASQKRRTVDIERELVHPHVRAAGGLVLHTNQLWADAWWAHTYSTKTPSNTADCTHWYAPYVPHKSANLSPRPRLACALIAWLPLSAPCSPHTLPSPLSAVLCFPRCSCSLLISPFPPCASLHPRCMCSVLAAKPVRVPYGDPRCMPGIPDVVASKLMTTMMSSDVAKV